MKKLGEAISWMNIHLRRRPPPEETPAPDPIDHPALLHMSPRELADLPLPRLAPRPFRAEAPDLAEPVMEWREIHAGACSGTA